MRTSIPLVVGLLGVAGPALGQQARLVADLNTTAVAVPVPALGGAVSTPAGVVFVMEGTSGIWRSDGSVAGTRLLASVTVADQPKQYLRDPARRLFPVPGGAVFAASSGGGADRLWRTDGTPAGTYAIANFPRVYGPDGTLSLSGPNISPMIAADDRVYFEVYRGLGTAPRELWRTDGTAEGTSRVFRDGRNASSSTGGPLNFELLSTAGPNVLFRAHPDTTTATRMYISDGTPDMATILLDDQGAPLMNWLAVFASGPKFVFLRAVAGNQVRFFRIDPNIPQLEAFGDPLPNSQFDASILAGDAAYCALTMGGGIHLVDAGQGLVSQVVPLQLDINERPAWGTNGRRLVAAASSGTLSDAFVADGTGSPATALRFPPDERLRLNRMLIPFGTGFLGGGGTFESGTEPLITDGTTSNTRIVLELRSEFRTGGWASDRAIVLNETTALFVGRRSPGPTYLWRTDGTAAGTMEVGFVPPFENASSSPRAFGVSGAGPFVLTSSALIRAADGQVLSAAASGNPGFSHAGRVYFRAAATGFGTELWSSDGTPGGTVRLTDFAPGSTSSFFDSFHVVAGRVTCLASGGSSVRGILSTDGTPGGTVHLADLAPGEFFGESAVATDGRLECVAVNAPAGGRVVLTDGTQAGTRTVQDAVQPPAGSSVQAVGFAGGSIVFVRTASESAGILWSCPASGIGAEPIFAIAGSGNVRAACTATSRAFFILQAAEQFSLLVTDGSAEGTNLVELAPTLRLDPGVPLGPVTAIGDSLLFQAITDAEGAELWISDGTPGGTRLLKDISPGVHDSFPRDYLRVGSVVYFSAEDIEFGRELWRTDGTTAGTVRITDIAPGPLSSSPSNLTRIGHSLYFAATDSRGEEPWVLSLCAADFNGDSDLNADDLSDYITLFFTDPTDPRLDVNASGTIDADDLSDYITTYFAGCEG